MTTLAPSETSVTVDPVFEYPRLRDRPINFASLRTRTDLYDKVFRTYVPYIPLELVDPEHRRALGWQNYPLTLHEGEHGEEETGETYKRATGDHIAGDSKMRPVPCEHPQMVPDPDVLYVGRLLDGLVWTGVFDDRTLAKHILDSTGNSGDQRVSGISGILRGGEFAAVTMQPVLSRETVEAAQDGVFDQASDIKNMILDEGRSPTINLSAFIKDVEPGEVINSSHTTHKTITAGVIAAGSTPGDMWAERLAEADWNPQIRLDSRFGLHYLKRGDRVHIETKGWPRPSSEPRAMDWVLRPPAEGRSDVQSSEGQTGIVNL